MNCSKRKLIKDKLSAFSGVNVLFQKSGYRYREDQYESEAYDELFRYFKFHDPFHETEEEIMATLAYIDVKNLAHRIQGEVKMITGLDDDVCYPITQFAIYNRLTCDKTYRIMPEYAHEAMNVFVNDQVYNWLCGSEIPFKYLK